MLRKYLYLDEDFINDAYATIFGYDHETEEITTNIDSHTGGKIGVSKVISAEGSKDTQSSNTTKISAAKTTAAKLQNILNYIENENGETLPYYEQLDENTFTSLHRDEMFEGVFQLSFTKIEQYAILSTVASDLAQVIGEDLDKATEEGLNSLISLAKQERTKGLICILSFIYNHKNYQCYCRLDERFLKTQYTLLQSEVTVIGKVSRIIPQGKTVNLTDLTELSKIKVPNINTRTGRTQRVQAIKNGANNSVKQFQDEIKGPALEIVPIAIYK